VCCFCCEVSVLVLLVPGNPWCEAALLEMCVIVRGTKSHAAGKALIIQACNLLRFLFVPPQHAYGPLMPLCILRSLGLFRALRLPPFSR
jgi:hypothetical protein